VLLNAEAVGQNTILTDRFMTSEALNK